MLASGHLRRLPWPFQAFLACRASLEDLEGNLASLEGPEEVESFLDILGVLVVASYLVVEAGTPLVEEEDLLEVEAESPLAGVEVHLEVEVAIPSEVEASSLAVEVVDPSV